MGNAQRVDQGHMKQVNNKLTPEQIRLLAFELTQVLSQDDPNAAARMVGEARIDPNPHQIEAALFGYRALQNGGAILGDEVGLGKTIEAGLILNQFWAEGKRRILIIPPVSLRGQWKDELDRLFYLQAQIINSNEWKSLTKAKRNPILRNEPGIYIVGEHLVNSNKKAFAELHFDLVVIDEAHRMRNVYKKKKNEAVIAKTVRDTFISAPKLLLTATPFQNNLNELYGLISLIDQSYFGSFESFQRLYSKSSKKEGVNIKSLRERIEPIFKRTLRNDVSHYLKYTERKSLTIRHQYDHDTEEEKIHKDLVELLKADFLLLNDKSSRGFVDLIYLKLLGSSPYALNPALLKMIARFFQGLVKRGAKEDVFEVWKNFAHEEIKKHANWESHWKKMCEFACGSPDLSFAATQTHINKNNDQEASDFTDDDDNSLGSELEENQIQEKASLSLAALEQPELLQTQISTIFTNYFRTHKPFQTGRAKSFIKTLQSHVSEAKTKGFTEKAVVFTEYKRTMQYVTDLIKSSSFSDYQIIPFHGGLSSKKDHNGVSERDRAIEEFRNAEKAILVCTEAGAEGLNLQFCNLIVNYDLPWNPQRIEQRIGRCHRYGQKNDVVVINFVCDENQAEKHIFKILSEKFTLFDGVFGASNTVLGVLESGTNLETLFSDLYLGVRSENEVENELQAFMELSEKERKAGVQKVAVELLSEFDPEVAKVLKMDWEKLKKDVSLRLSTFEEKLASYILSEIPDTRYDHDNGTLHCSNEAFPSLSHRPHTLQRIYATDEKPLVTVKHDEINPRLTRLRNEEPVLDSQYSITLPEKIMQRLNLNSGDQCVLAAFNWKVTGVATYEHIEICLKLPSGELKSGPQLQEVVSELSRGSRDTTSKIDLEESLNHFYEQTEERLEEDRDEKSNKIFTDKLLVKQRAKYDQEEAERRLTDERRELSADFDMQILKASMKQKASLLKKKESALKELDKEVQVYRDTIKSIEKQEAELNKQLIGIHDKGSVQRHCIFACQVIFS